MQRSRFVAFALIVATTFEGGCGGSSMMAPPPTPNSAQVSVSMTDAPPTGVTVLSFEVSLTGASLNPGGADLLAGKGPIRIEVKHLETEAAFLSTASVTPGTFSALNMTFANPELTFQNNTSAVLAGCAVGAVCEIKPAGTLTSTFNFPASGLTLGSSSSVGLLVDVNLNTLLSSTLGVDFGASGATTVQQLPQPPHEGGEVEELDDLVGIVANKDATNNQFTLQTTQGNFTVSVDGSTQFENFSNCASANFTCVVNGQSVEADLEMMATGSFVAKKIELEDDTADDELEGIVFKVDSGTQFEIVVVGELRDVANVNVGNPVIVTLQSGTSFQVDTNGLSVPSALQQAFESVVDTSQLVVGQDVQIRDRSLSAGSPISVAADRVRLRMTRFTATESGAPSGSNFNVANLPALFMGAGISQIQVQTSSQTNFENVSGITGLADGTTVSLRGLLFLSTPSPVLVADKVRKR